jgi:hypothetical protein
MQAMTRDKATRFLGAYRAPAEWENAGLVAAGVGTVICGLFVAVRTVLLVIKTHFSLLQWDEWDVLRGYITVATGKASLMSWLWQQHTEHRVPLARLLFILDTEVAGGTQVLTKTITLVLAGLLATLFILLLLRQKKIPLGARLIGVGFLAMLFFSNVQMENFIRGFNNQVLTVIWFSVLALYLLIKAIEKKGGDNLALVLFCCALLSAIMATFSMSNGLAIWPVLFIICVRWRNWPWAATIALIGAAIATVYLWDYQSPGGHPNPLNALKDPVSLLHYYFAFLGNPVGLESLKTSTLFGAFGLLLIAYHFFRQGRLIDGDGPFVSFLFGVCLFVLGTGCLTAVGRSGFGLGQALSLRYASFVAPLWAAVLILGFLLLKKNLKDDPGKVWTMLDTVVLIIPICICGSIFFAQSAGRNYSLGEYDHYQRATTAIVAGAPDQVALKYAHPSAATVLSLVPYLASNRLSIFHSNSDYFLYQKAHEALHKPLAGGMALDGKWCAGAIDDVPRMTNPAQANTSWNYVTGWALDRDGEQSADGALFADGEGRLVGVARILVPREDVDRALNLRRKRMLVHYIGYVEAGDSESIIGYAYRADRNSLCRFGERKIR